MNLNPFKSKRRPKTEFWALDVELDVDSTSLRPSGDAKHDVLLKNLGTMAYEITVHGQCGPMLRYGSNEEWGPHEKELKPKEKSTLRGKIGLPSACDKSQLPTFERIAIKVDARPVNPRALSQDGFLYCDFELSG